MRAAISLLVTTFIFGSLAFGTQNLFQSTSETQLTASKIKPGSKPKKPEKPFPHRGSGRRELMEYFVISHPAV